MRSGTSPSSFSLAAASARYHGPTPFLPPPLGVTLQDLRPLGGILMSSHVWNPPVSLGYPPHPRTPLIPQNLPPSTSPNLPYPPGGPPISKATFSVPPGSPPFPKGHPPALLPVLKPPSSPRGHSPVLPTCSEGPPASPRHHPQHLSHLTTPPKFPRVTPPTPVVPPKGYFPVPPHASRITYPQRGIPHALPTSWASSPRAL